MVEDDTRPAADQGADQGASRDGSLTAEDQGLIDGIERAIADAAELQRWWRQTDAENAYAERFELAASHNRPDTSFGFFDQTEVAGSSMSIMGNVQEQLYDRPKTPARSAAARNKAAQWMDRQVREFVLRYFMRISDFRPPQAFPGDPREAPPAHLRPFSWLPDEDAETGFGFQQVYYKRKDEESPRRFSDHERYAIVDLREIGKTYDWVVVKVEIFNLEFVLAPFGQKHPYGTVPGTEQSYLVLAEDFILDEQSPEGSDDLGRYGFGYAFLPSAEDSILAYGPGRFEAGFQAIHFHVRRSGEVVSRMAFVANRPEKVVNVSADPVSWSLRLAEMFSFGTASPVLEPMQKMWERVPHPGGVDVVQSYITLANMISGGAAGRNLGVSRKQLHKNFLMAHFAQHYNVVAGSLVTWRQISDWLETENLPEWVVSGESS